ncbi:hypothetical protein H072_11599 [Dactylellina haptotyla CBS 200.50]|uniref:Rhodopsin domain-containing protein n=1 Tax=Dactylellina haptotyla (strain CBS 200.50) TaxID=1284197 RepID=S8A1Y0_DACHA|nr:hypothetical protein H072_11599 [Dactylellina haptotyla CBS 200.50]
MLPPPHPQTDEDRAYILSLVPVFRQWPDNFEFPLVTIPGYKPPSNTLYAVIISFIVGLTAMSVVSLRLWVRFKERSTMGMDDIVMIPTFMLYMAFTINNTYAVFATGFGYHLYDLSRQDIKSNLVVTYLHVIFSFGALHLCRISIQHLLLRLTPPQYSTRRRWYLYILISFSYAFVIGAVLTQVFQCGLPISRNFDLRTALDGTCVSLHSTTVYGIFMTGHILLDALTLFPPIFVLYELPMPKKKKNNLIFLLVLGVITMILSAIKPFYFYARMVKSFDITWNSVVVGFVGIMELSLAITIASLPALNRHIVKFWNKWSSSSSMNGEARAPSFVARFGAIKFHRRPSGAQARRPVKNFLSFTMSTTTGTTTLNQDMDTKRDSYLELRDVKDQDTLRLQTVSTLNDIERDAPESPLTSRRDNFTGDRIAGAIEEGDERDGVSPKSSPQPSIAPITEPKKARLGSIWSFRSNRSNE